MTKIIIALFSLSLGGAFAIACYDAKKVPPCTGGEEWPHPCAQKSRDAGRD